MQDLLNAFGFLSQNIHIAGWVALISISWKLSWKVSKFFSDLSDSAYETKAAAERTKDMQQTINTVATNHLPHLQETSGQMVEELKGMRRDMLQYFLSKKE